jgi:hypothetical protein
LVGPEPSEQRRNGNDDPSTESAGRELASTGRLVGGCASETEEGSDFLDAEGDAMLEVIERGGSDSLGHVGTSL